MDKDNLLAYLTRFHAVGEGLPPTALPGEKPSQRGYESYCRIVEGGYLEKWRAPYDPKKYEGKEQ